MGSPRGTSLLSSCTKLGEFSCGFWGSGADYETLRHMVPFDQPEAALVSYSMGRSRQPHANSTLFAGPHHEMGQERSSHKLSRT